jgi:DNA mismatch repair ATPase MutS
MLADIALYCSGLLPALTHWPEIMNKGLSSQVAEHLIGLGVYTLFATHFPKLSELAVLYPNCKIWHLDVTPETSNGAAGLCFKRKLVAGNQRVQHYGLALAPAVRPFQSN